MALLEVLEPWAPNLTKVLRHDAWWMAWNTFLAWLPVVLAFAVFRRRAADHVRTPLWWTGVVLFVLFLPNAPYVVTDLVHLRDDVVLVGGSWPVVTGVMPVYIAFIGSGFVAYYLALRELTLYLERVGLASWHAVTTAGIHGLAAVGVYLGRTARLNSWEPVVEPHDTLQRAVLTLSWQWAPPKVPCLCTRGPGGSASTATLRHVQRPQRPSGLVLANPALAAPMVHLLSAPRTTTALPRSDRSGPSSEHLAGI